MIRYMRVDSRSHKWALLEIQKGAHQKYWNGDTKQKKEPAITKWQYMQTSKQTHIQYREWGEWQWAQCI